MQERDWEKGYPTDTCLSTQDTFKKYLDYFRIPYENWKLTHGLFKAVREFSVIYRLCENDKIASRQCYIKFIVCT